MTTVKLGQVATSQMFRDLEAALRDVRSLERVAGDGHAKEWAGRARMRIECVLRMMRPANVEVEL